MGKYRIKHSPLPEFCTQADAQSCPARDNDPVNGLRGYYYLVIPDFFCVPLDVIRTKRTKSNPNSNFRFVEVLKRRVFRNTLGENKIKPT